MLVIAAGAASFFLLGQTPKTVPFASPVPALTNAPEISATQASGPQSEQARTFAETILTAIAQRKPDFEDDFSKADPAWYFGNMRGTSAIEEGVARLRSSGDVSMANDAAMTGKDFVLQFDARLVSGDTTSQINVGLHTVSDRNKFFLFIHPAVKAWEIGGEWGNDFFPTLASGENDAVSPVSGTTQITIITRGSRFALYLNQTPVGFFDNGNFDNAGRTEIHCASSSPAVSEFDNVKFWNLAKTNTPAIPLASPVPSLTNPPKIPATQASGLQPVPSLTNAPEIPATQALDPKSEQAGIFAEPILTAIAQSKPDFEDDFTNVNPVWKFGGLQGFFSAIEDGVARIHINPGEGFITESEYMVKRDFVLKFDARLVSGDSASKIMITFHTYPETTQLILELFPTIHNWDISRVWNALTLSGEDDALIAVGKTMQITIIMQGSRFALYLGQTPISFINDENIHSGLATDNSRRIFIHCESNSLAVCEFDNVKFWDLANVPGLP